jgi:beta-glucosidase
MAQVKHLAGYNGLDNVVIDERTLHEIYLPAFEAAVKAGAASVMCAYNKINGSWACESAELQDGILRGQWGFKGFVTSDWGAVHTPSAITRRDPGFGRRSGGKPHPGPDGPFRLARPQSTCPAGVDRCCGGCGNRPGHCPAGRGLAQE